MASTETNPNSWPKTRGPIFTVSSDKEIADAFDAFDAFTGNENLKAMIISADPFFQFHKGAFITAANNPVKYVCYPLQSFNNSGAIAAQQPAGGRHTRHGPKLATEYYNLGVMANSVITHARPSTLRLVEIQQRFMTGEMDVACWREKSREEVATGASNLQITRRGDLGRPCAVGFPRRRSIPKQSQRSGRLPKSRPSYAAQLLRLTILAPDIVGAILGGKHPPELTARKLMDDTRLPLEWTERRRSLGFA